MAAPVECGLKTTRLRPLWRDSGLRDIPHAKIQPTTAARSRLYRSLHGNTDLYVTILMHSPAPNSGPSALLANPEWLTGKRHCSTVISPRPGHETPYWEDAQKLFASRTPDADSPAWTAHRCRLILTGVHPCELVVSTAPIIRLDVTATTPAEARIVANYIRDVFSKIHLSPFRKQHSIIAPLLAGVVTGDREDRESGDIALDHLGLMLTLCPSLIVDFIGLPPNTNDLLRSYVTETLTNAPGAVPYSSVLKLRQVLLKEYGGTYTLPDEEAIRAAWKKR